MGPTHTYHAANLIATTLIEHGECGLSDNSFAGDWRLPTDQEWRDTIARANTLGCTNPSLTDTAGTGCYAVGAQPFTDVQSDYYWSSASNAGNPSYAYFVYLGSGIVDYGFKTIGNLHVWPVRGGQ